MNNKIIIKPAALYANIVATSLGDNYIGIEGLSENINGKSPENNKSESELND